MHSAQCGFKFAIPSSVLAFLLSVNISMANILELKCKAQFTTTNKSFSFKDGNKEDSQKSSEFLYVTIFFDAEDILSRYPYFNIENSKEGLVEIKTDTQEKYSFYNQVISVLVIEEGVNENATLKINDDFIRGRRSYSSESKDEITSTRFSSEESLEINRISGQIRISKYESHSMEHSESFFDFWMKKFNSPPPDKRTSEERTGVGSCEKIDTSKKKF